MMKREVMSYSAILYPNYPGYHEPLPGDGERFRYSIGSETMVSDEGVSIYFEWANVPERFIPDVIVVWTVEDGERRSREAAFWVDGSVIREGDRIKAVVPVTTCAPIINTPAPEMEMGLVLKRASRMILEVTEDVRRHYERLKDEFQMPLAEATVIFATDVMMGAADEVLTWGIDMIDWDPDDDPDFDADADALDDDEDDDGSDDDE